MRRADMATAAAAMLGRLRSENGGSAIRNALSARTPFIFTSSHARGPAHRVLLSSSRSDGIPTSSAADWPMGTTAPARDGIKRMRVLVVEDNQNLVANLFEYFEARGYELDAAPDGPTGLHLALTQDYDVIVLDWMLPRMDGREVLAHLRSAGRHVPVLMLTARAELDDKIGAFRGGADDYLTKPFDLPELEVRLEALASRARGRGRRVLEVADLRLDLATLEVTRAGRSLHLYPAGRKLLGMLMQASPAAVSRERLERGLWGDSPPDGDMLRSHVYELRRSVDGPFATKLIHTLPRVGYRLAAPESADPADSSSDEH